MLSYLSPIALSLLSLCALYTVLTLYVTIVSESVEIKVNSPKGLYLFEVVIDGYRGYRIITIGFLPNRFYRKDLSFWKFIQKLIFYRNYKS